MAGVQQFTLGSGQPEAEVDFGSGGGLVSVVGGTVYYRDEPGVTAGTSDGSIASGSSVTLFGTQFFSSVAARVDGLVRLADVPVSSSAVAADRTGATDVTTTIQAALDALATTGGTVLLPAGTYLVSYRDNPAYPGFYSALRIPSGVTLAGAGMGKTILKLAAGQASQTSATIIANKALDASPTADENVGVRDLCLDGNGANQTVLYQGMEFARTRGLRLTRVRVINVRGTAATPPGETFAISIGTSVDAVITDCEIFGTAGTQGSGIGVNASTNVMLHGCLVRSMSAGMGFAIWSSRDIAIVGCTAQNCGANGINVEESEGVAITGCVAGGRANSDASSGVLTANQNLGNGHGIVINGTVRASVVGCYAAYNTGSGIRMVTGTVRSAVVVTGCTFSNNSEGIYVADATTAAQCRCEGSIVRDNTTTNWTVQGSGGPGNFGGVGTGVMNVASPTVPASGADLTNPFPFPVTIYLSAAPNFVVIDAAINLGAITTIRLAQGSQIRLGYSVAPSWTWMKDA